MKPCPIPAYTDELLSEDSDEFTLDDDIVPDFRHLSDSDPEPEPPLPDHEDDDLYVFNC